MPDILEGIKKLRLELCHGPGGLSVSMLDRRVRQECVLKDAAAEIRRLRSAIEKNNSAISYACGLMCPGGYLERGLHHPDCPSGFIIDLDEP